MHSNNEAKVPKAMNITKQRRKEIKKMTQSPNQPQKKSIREEKSLKPQGACAKITSKTNQKLLLSTFAVIYILHL